MQPLSSSSRGWTIGPLHAALLGAVWPLFLGALLSDYAYWRSYHIQWSNFAAWLLVGAMVMATLALVCAIVALIRGQRHLGYVLVLLATWGVGFFDAVHHGRDAWAIMPTALVLSVIATALALVATVLGFARLRGGAR
ncbi:hypothetical protein [Xanthomonas maliensis]|uniref:hypothetical protein n=1 Tax=Xanthomonas maliensis TaxID=1321368 RepID=UPI0003A1260B|nr:hypothetical protein [Xanthomonas maliensis]KAB7771925.1 hypothetical protein CKY51_01885 [Xanthomonas maliensis]